MNELLVYIDPGFLDNIGHYRNFADNIHEEARKRGVNIWHFVNGDISEDIAEEYGLDRKFQYKAILKENESFQMRGLSRTHKLVNTMAMEIFDRLQIIRGFELKTVFNCKALLKLAENLIDNYKTRVLKSFSVVLEMILDRVSKNNYDKISIYMYTSHPLYFPVFAKLLNLERYSTLNIQAYLGLFYLDPGFCRNESVPKYERMLRSISGSVEKYDPDQRVNLCADSERIVSCYSPYFRRSIKVFPIPLGKIADHSRVSQQLKKNIEKIIIGFLGYAHIKQGYHLVRDLYLRIVNAKGYSHVNFIMRHNTNLGIEDMSEMVDEFKKETERIVHLIGDLPKDKYEEQVSNCDIILMPHSRAEYPCQTSGLFVDSLRKRKVVVVPEDTWMADMIKQYGSGEIFKSGDISSFVNAVKKVCDNFPRYHSNTERNIEAFSMFHTAESLFDAMGIGQ